jgi:hypothetical protein
MRKPLPTVLLFLALVGAAHTAAARASTYTNKGQGLRAED